jgi:putative restriction endonuclease
VQPFVANTDRMWFDFLASRAVEGRVDEVNFWSPRATRPLKRMSPGAPVFFRLKSPANAVAGYGFFAHFSVLGLQEAWDCFDWKNGDPDVIGFLLRIGRYRGVDLLDARAPQAPIGCTVLRDARFWPRSDWMPWGEGQGWPRNVVQGRTEDDPVRARELLDRVTRDSMHIATLAEWADGYELVAADQRRFAETRLMVREGQGSFRSRLIDAYQGRCAITGEHTVPVLDAAHIQPYLGPQSNHVQNGILLTKEFHALFDRGYVTITPEYVVRVSPRLRDTWHNGVRFYGYDDQPLIALPGREAEKPSRRALAWHGEVPFKA